MPATLPSAVQRQQDEVDRMHQERYGNPGEPAPAPQEPNPAPEDPAPPAEKPPQESPQEPNPPDPAPSETVSDSEWKRRFTNFKKQADRTIHDLRLENRDLQGRLQGLEEQVRALSQPAQQPAPGPNQAAPDEPLLSEDEREEYGDLANLIERVAGQIAQREIAKHVDPVKQSLEETQRRTEKTTEATYEGRLDDLVPEWRQLNGDQGFLDWLAEVEGYSGKSRHELLLEAHQGKDALRVSRFFLDYQAEKKAANPTPEAKPEHQVAPDSRPSAGPPPANDRIWTNNQIQKVYDDYTLKRISEDEFQRLDREIQRAVQEGRVQR